MKANKIIYAFCLSLGLALVSYVLHPSTGGVAIAGGVIMFVGLVGFVLFDEGQQESK